MGSLGVALWSVVGSLFIELAGYLGMLMETFGRLNLSHHHESLAASQIEPLLMNKASIEIRLSPVPA